MKKLPARSRIIFFFLAFFSATGLQHCIREEMAGSTSTGNAGTIMGTVYGENGQPVSGARVEIVNVDHNPNPGLAKLAATPQTLVTDHNGEFISEVLDPGAYNVIASSGGNGALTDSVPVRLNFAASIEQTLEPLGSLTGRIELYPGHDPSTVFFLVFGTQTWVAADSQGVFVLNGMAEGRYYVRILSALDGYNTLDTILRITSGRNDTLPEPIKLPFVGLPEPSNPSVEYDTLRQYVTFRWKVADPSLVAGYNVYRRDSVFNSGPAAPDSVTDYRKINSFLVRDSSYTDSSLWRDGSYEYKVAAVDSQDRQGTKGPGARLEFQQRMKIAEITAPDGLLFGGWHQRTIMAFKNKIWLMGEIYKPGGKPSPADEVWSSFDGTTWERAGTQVGYPDRFFRTSVVFAGKLWFLGGQVRNNGFIIPTNEVWNSDDGTAWEQVMDTASFPARVDHKCVVFQDKIWLVGGWNAQPLNDVWNSGDGMEWTLVTDSAAFPARAGHELLVFNGRLWLIGGASSGAFHLADTTYADVWSSTDGKEWIRDVENAGFLPRAGHTALVRDSVMWLFGGRLQSSGPDTGFPDIWVSRNGTSWYPFNAHPEFPVQPGLRTVVFSQKLWIFGHFPGNSPDQWSAWYIE